MPSAYADLANALTPNPSLKLAQLRDQRRGELEDALANDPGNARLKALLGIVSADQAEDPDTGVAARKQLATTTDTLDQASLEQDPRVTALRQTQLAPKLAVAKAPAEAQAAGALAVEREKNLGERQKIQQQEESTKGLLETMTGGQAQSGIAGPGGSIKPTINAQGGVSFTTTQMPALVQRAHSQLSEAHNQHLEALQEAERLWPGINDAATGADQGTAPGAFGSLKQWMSGITGIGAPQYGAPSDALALASETYRYRARQSTPLSNFIQKASFGNLEQMAGQLPGVRGLATVVPLFREHQTALTSNNPGTPLATVQRLRHLINSEESALEEMLHQGQEQ